MDAPAFLHITITTISHRAGERMKCFAKRLLSYKSLDLRYYGRERIAENRMAQLLTFSHRTIFGYRAISVRNARRLRRHKTGHTCIFSTLKKKNKNFLRIRYTSVKTFAEYSILGLMFLNSSYDMKQRIQFHSFLS